jgi:catechol 2,3-dioxygenase-like lactoylglutathione lyase family enzyme
MPKNDKDGRPLLGGVHHISINVTDFQRSLEFYRDVLGLEPVFEPEEVTGPGFARAAGLDRARFRYTQLKVGDGSTLVELVQFLEPKGSKTARKVYDPGAAHVEFKVDDVAAAKARLEARGVRFNSEPIRIGDGPLKREILRVLFGSRRPHIRAVRVMRAGKLGKKAIRPLARKTTALHQGSGTRAAPAEHKISYEKAHHERRGHGRSHDQ